MKSGFAEIVQKPVTGPNIIIKLKINNLNFSNLYISDKIENKVIKLKKENIKVNNLIKVGTQRSFKKNNFWKMITKNDLKYYNNQL